MPAARKDLRIKTRDDYRQALKRVAELRGSGATAENNEELALIEGAIAAYVSIPGQPAEKKARPKDEGEGM
jgi:hypothetical protein